MFVQFVVVVDVLVVVAVVVVAAVAAAAAVVVVVVAVVVVAAAAAAARQQLFIRFSPRPLPCTIGEKVIFHFCSHVRQLLLLLLARAPDGHFSLFVHQDLSRAL